MMNSHKIKFLLTIFWPESPLLSSLRINPITTRDHVSLSYNATD